MSFLAAFIHRQFFSEPPVPTASFKGRTCIVTGSNVGLGLEACRWIVKLGASQVILATETVRVWRLDLSSYASVIAFAKKVKAELPRLDVLVGNAGIGATMNFRMTEDNEEIITTNVVSLSLLGFLLNPKLQETAVRFETPTHFTVTASELYEVARFKESKVLVGQIFATLNDETIANMADRYNVSKLLEIFLIKQMAAMSPLSSSNVIVNCVAPGLCQSALHREHDNRFTRILLKMIARRAETGSRTLVYGASAGPDTHGQYLPDCKITQTKGLCKGEAGVELKKRVWEELMQKLEVIRPGVTSLA